MEREEYPEEERIPKRNPEEERYVLRHNVAALAAREGSLIGGRVGPDEKNKALSRIIALEASKIAEVVSFRNDILQNGLLDREKVSAWIKRQAEADGPVRGWEYVDDRFDYSAIKGRAVFGQWTKKIKGRDRNRRVNYEYQPGLLAFVTYKEAEIPPGFIDEKSHKVVLPSLQFQPVCLDGVLGRLKSVVDLLIFKYPAWQEHWTTMFVLAGELPPINMALISTETLCDIPSMRRIRMVIDPRLSPEDVAKAYAKARGLSSLPTILEEQKQRERKMSEKHITLALFAAEVAGAETTLSWSEMLDEWNEKYPDWSYDRSHPSVLSYFPRDVRDAWYRITGLSWDKYLQGRQEK